MDNISEFLDTLTILKDETSDLSITNYIVGALLLLCAIILLIVSIHALYYSSNHTSCISLAIFSLIMCAFIIFIAISIILAAQIHIKLIISTENMSFRTKMFQKYISNRKYCESASVIIGTSFENVLDFLALVLSVSCISLLVVTWH